jgi:uncharacterized protein
MTVRTITNVSFDSKVERTQRVLEVAEAFGIGLDDKRFVIYDNCKLDIEDSDIVYITGQSGSGKSVLLRELARQLSEAGKKVVNIDQIILAEKPIVELVGENIQESLEILAKAGLNDAYLFIRKPSELSDGQRYRLRLALLMVSNTDVWVADEFGAILDRTTAKIIAFSISKYARQLGKTLIVATTHTDLEDELAPTYRIDKRFREKLVVKQNKPSNV